MEIQKILKNVEALIIDDEADICYLLSSILKPKELDTTYVNNLSEASKILEVANPKIVFLDNHLPDGLGINFVREIRERHPQVKIIMITAHDTPYTRNKAYEKGVDYFIGKPFTKDEVYQTVKEALKN